MNGSGTPPGFLELWSLIDHAVWSSLVIAATCGLLGIFVHLRRVIFVGVALSQAAACGIALAFLAELASWTAVGTAFSLLRNPTVMGIAVQVAAVLLLTVWREGNRVTREAIIGIVYCAAGALSILFVAQSAAGMEEVKTLISGDILGATARDTWMLLSVLVPVVALQLLFLNRFLFVAFDHEMAETAGIRAPVWDMLFFLSLGIAISLAIRTTGTLFVFAYLVLPPAAALLLARRVGSLLFLAAGIGVSADLFGLWLSVRWDLPSGPSAVASALLFFLGAAAMARVRSIVAPTGAGAAA